MVVATAGSDAAFACLGRFREAFRELNRDAAHEHILEALHANPTVAWHEIVRTHSAAFNSTYSSEGYFNTACLQADRAADERLCELIAVLEKIYHPEMINVPPRTSDPASIEACETNRKRAVDEGSPYFVFIPQEKSGSTSFGNIVPNGFRLPCVTYSSSIVSVIPSWAKACAKGGGAYITHLRPRREAIANLYESNLRRIVVHTRDPRQIYLSLLHHFELYQSDWPDLERSGYYSLSFSEKAQCQLAVYDYILSWIAGWVEAAKEGRLEILFTIFEDFLLNRTKTVEKLLSFYQGDMGHFNAETAYETSDDVDYHFRRGEVDEWRREFDASLARQLTEKIPNSWFTQFAWEP